MGWTNIFLILLMIASLGGMLWCTKDSRNRPVRQLIALLLLVLVLVSGGLFMWRLGALAVPGWEDNSADHRQKEQKLREAQGYVVANFIHNSYPERKKILLISRAGNQAFNETLRAKLHEAGDVSVIREELNSSLVPVPGADNLITPGEGVVAEAAEIEAAIARHPDAEVIIISGIAPSGDSLARLKVYRLPDRVRPKIIVLGVSNLTDRVARQIENGVFSAMVVTDLTRAFQEDEVLPENLMEVFHTRYVLITQDNLRRNRRFFR